MANSQGECWQRLFQYPEILNQYREKGNQLSDLLTDVEINRSNKIFLIIDFSEIQELASLEETTSEEGQIRKEAMATLLCGKVPFYATPVLINPYRTEFRRRINWIKERADEIEKRLKMSEEGKELRFAELGEELKRISSEPEINEDDRNSLIEMLKEFDLHDVIRREPLAMVKMYKKVDELIGKNKLPKSIEELSLTMHPNFGNSRYFKAQLLSRYFTILNNYIDSQALELIDLVNQKSNNIILLFYSGTQKMKHILRQTDVARILKDLEIPLGMFRLKDREETLNFMRTPEMMADLFNLIKEGDNWEKALAAKNSKIAEIVGIGTAVENFLHTCPKDPEGCKYKEVCRAELNRIELKINEHRELISAINICDIFSNYREFFEIAEQCLRKEEEIVKILLNNMGGIEEFFRDEKDDIIREVNDILEFLNGQFIELFQYETFEKLKSRLGRLRGKPYYIFFPKGKTKAVIDDLMGLIEDESKEEVKDLERIKNKYRELLQCITQRNLGSEKDLLLAVLLFAHSYYDEATNLTQEQMRDLGEDHDLYPEFCLINILSCYFDYATYEKGISRILARDRAKRFLKKREDPRIYNALGVIMLSFITETNEDNDRIIESEVIGNYRKALTCIKRNKFRKKTGDLESVLKNNIADAILRKKKISPQELREVRNLVDQVGNMEYHFVKDTVAKFLEREFRESKEMGFLERAIEEYEKAIHLAIKEERDEYLIGIEDYLGGLLEEAMMSSKVESAHEFDETLLLRGFFYLYVHARDKNKRVAGLKEIRRLLMNEIRSVDRNLGENVEKAKKDGHRNLVFLEELKRVMVGDRSIEVLSDFKEWLEIEA